MMRNFEDNRTQSISRANHELLISVNSSLSRITSSTFRTSLPPLKSLQETPDQQSRTAQLVLLTISKTPDRPPEVTPHSHSRDESAMMQLGGKSITQIWVGETNLGKLLTKSGFHFLVEVNEI